MWYGKHEDDKRLLRYVVETVSGRRLSSKLKIDALKAEIYKLISSSPTLFNNVTDDPAIDIKAFISECVEYGLIKNRNGFYYSAADNQALCNPNEDPTFSNAAKYIGSPANLKDKIVLEEKLRIAKEG